MSTKKLFSEDAYMKECNATITQVNKVDDRTEVMLDQTGLFAFSGGQASDFGTINDVTVESARVSEDKTDIVYTFAEDKMPLPFKEGNQVTIKIDWDRRYKIMKLHSAAHLIYFLFAEKTGLKKLIGSNISVDKGRLDYEMDESISPMLPEMEVQANKFLSQSHEIQTYPDEDQPNKRSWVCEEWKAPCGGTHVKNTTEIGTVKLKRKNIGAGKERVEVMLVE